MSANSRLPHLFQQCTKLRRGGPTVCCIAKSVRRFYSTTEAKLQRKAQFALISLDWADGVRHD